MDGRVRRVDKVRDNEEGGGREKAYEKGGRRWQALLCVFVFVFVFVCVCERERERERARARARHWQALLLHPPLSVLPLPSSSPSPSSLSPPPLISPTWPSALIPSFASACFLALYEGSAVESVVDNVESWHSGFDCRVRGQLGLGSRVFVHACACEGVFCMWRNPRVFMLK